MNLIVILNHFGVKGEEYQEITLLFLTLIFFGTNIYWAGYVFLLEYKFPRYISKYCVEVLFGVGVLAEKKLKEWSDRASRRIGNSQASA